MKAVITLTRVTWIIRVVQMDLTTHTVTNEQLSRTVLMGLALPKVALIVASMLESPSSFFMMLVSQWGGGNCCYQHLC